VNTTDSYDIYEPSLPKKKSNEFHLVGEDIAKYMQGQGSNI